MPGRKDHLRVAVQVVVYFVFYIALLAFFLEPLMRWGAGDLAGLTSSRLLGALAANWLGLRIFTEFRLPDIGLWWNRRSADNLAYGLAGGIAAASIVLGVALLAGVAHFAPSVEHPSLAVAPFVLTLLAMGSAGEEIFFRGFGFQTLMANYGEWAAIIPLALVFGLLHLLNPNASLLGAANTVAFGVIFGYAYARTHDLWLAIGLHFGWNFTLPLFGAPLSGLRMNVTGYEMKWTAGALLSGGDYGPEASLLTSVVVVALFFFLRRAPVRRQPSPLTDPPIGSEVCEPPLLPS